MNLEVAADYMLRTAECVACIPRLSPLKCLVQYVCNIATADKYMFAEQMTVCVV